MRPKNCDGGKGRRDHADRLQRDRRNGHPAAHGSRHDLGDVRAARGKIDPDPDSDQKLAGDDQPGVGRDRAQGRTSRQDRHVRNKCALAAEPVRRNAAERSAKHSPKDKSRAYQANEDRVNRQVPLEQGNGDPERDDREAIEQSAATGEQPIHIAHRRHRRFVEDTEDGHLRRNRMMSGSDHRPASGADGRLSANPSVLACMMGLLFFVRFHPFHGGILMIEPSDFL